MRTQSTGIGRTRAVYGALVVLMVGAMALAARPAAAQGDLGGPPTYGAIRLGVYLPTNSTVRDNVGKDFFCGGIDYTFQQSATNRAQIDFDYIERSNHGNDVRDLPLTVSDIYYMGPRAGGVRPYWGLGLGAYFVHVHVPNPNSSQTTGNPSAATINATDTVFGGFVEAGLEFPENVFLDARYHEVSEVSHVNTSGFDFEVGYRF